MMDVFLLQTEVVQLRQLVEVLKSLNETNDKIIAQYKEKDEKNEEIIKLQREIIEMVKNNIELARLL
jgi:hypothetical protein